MPEYRFDGSRLRAARKAAGYDTADELGRVMRRSESLIKFWELGYREPSPSQLAALGVELDVPIESFFVEVDDEQVAAQ